MTRYIDADKLLEYLEKAAESEDVKYSVIGAGVQAAISVIKTFPMENVAPVIHAHWIRKRMLSHDGELYCSNCEWTPEVIAVGGTTVHDLQLADVYFCPHCGAKMDEVIE